MVDTLVALAAVLGVDAVKLLVERDVAPTRLKGGRKRLSDPPSSQLAAIARHGRGSQVCVESARHERFLLAEMGLTFDSLGEF